MMHEDGHDYTYDHEKANDVMTMVMVMRIFRTMMRQALIFVWIRNVEEWMPSHLPELPNSNLLFHFLRLLAAVVSIAVLVAVRCRCRRRR